MPAPANQKLRSTSLVLKVDVDTRVGLVQGVPRLANMFNRLGVKASFFVAMGPDRSGRALARLRKPGFLRKQLRSGAAGAYGLRTMLYGLLLPGPIIAASAPGLLNSLRAQGHEVGLHGWDHVFWHDRLRTLEPARVRAQLGRAWRLYQEITGAAPASFASPGWQITDQALLALVQMGITHVSCTRGSAPFRPLVSGRALPIVELPTTLPTLDEVLGRGGVSEANAAQHLAGQVQPGRLNVFTLHGEVEGRAQAPVLEEFIGRLQEQGVRFLRLIQAAAEAAAAGLPGEAIAWAEAPGRAGELAWQASALPAGGAA
ncbi:MAG: 4-deoxy-4-formamido-L-arabinose-phosphoundecaprenol deformylase [Desulfarculus sp.]|nr:MAG: 4-deoxy-4-formamido-L-arabinose-phosphoundecaprenol deformylase [Desulfarculus sp.]